MAARKKIDRVAVLETHIDGEILVIGSNPTEEEVLNFVAEHNRRYHAGEAGGPNPELRAFLIKSAAFYAHQDNIGNPAKATPIDISEYVQSSVTEG